MNPVIKVIGVGGSGSNTVSRMERLGVNSVELISVNTDAQALHFSKANKKILIGKNITNGLGTGMDANIGSRAAEESREEISENLCRGSELVTLCISMTYSGYYAGGEHAYVDGSGQWRGLHGDLMVPGEQLYLDRECTVPTRVTT